MALDPTVGLCDFEKVSAIFARLVLGFGVLLVWVTTHRPTVGS